MESTKLVIDNEVVSKRLEFAKKKEIIITRLKNDATHSLKGKYDLLNKIRKQKEEHLAKETKINSQTAEDSTVENVILKQQNLLQKLNNENIDLIEENEKLRKLLAKKSSTRESNSEWLDREQSLKEQLHLSQKYSVHFLSKYVSVLKK
jgi:hypothetical protein